MQELTLSTDEVLAFKQLGRNIDSAWVDWAVNMLVSGSDTPSLRILAGEIAPFNQFEMKRLVDQVFNELDLNLYASRKDAVLAITKIRVQQLLDRTIPISVALLEIADLCLELNYDTVIYDFYLLHLAYEDLQVVKVQYHWPEANQGNIEEVIHNYCQTWNRKHTINV